MSQLGLFGELREERKPIEVIGDGPECVLMLGDCLERMREIPDSSVDLILTDPPYFRVKPDEWDNQWSETDAFLSWLESVAREWHRVLKSNGSLYCFCSPKLTSETDLMLRKVFNVLSVIRWVKPKGQSRAYGTDPNSLRGFFPDHESIIFCEHYGADNAAKGESGYVRECDKLRGFVFEPLRQYFISERKRAGLTREKIREFFSCKLGTKGKVSGHYYDLSQWMLPTKEHYQWLREIHNSHAQGDYLRREYDYLRREYEDLRREYEDLRREYEDLRRPFYLTKEDQITATWTFDTVRPRKGKHPCEKPIPMLEYILKVSSREGATVFDSFAGSFNTGIACCSMDRKFIGIERDKGYFDRGKRRIEEAGGTVTIK